MSFWLPTKDDGLADLDAYQQKVQFIGKKKLFFAQKEADCK